MIVSFYGQRVIEFVKEIPNGITVHARRANRNSGATESWPGCLL